MSKQETNPTATAKEVLKFFDDLKGEYPKHVERIDELVKAFEPIKGLDLRKAVDEIERLKARQEEIVKSVRTNRNGPYVPGLEDETEAKKFRMTRAAYAIKTGDWDGAGYEKEVLDQVRPKMKHVIGVDTQGGYFVPDQIIADVIGAIYTRSVLIDLTGDGVTRLSVIDGLFGGEVRIPKFKGGMIAFWIGELDEYVESATKFGDVSMSPKKLTLLTRMSEEMRRFGGLGFENLLRQDMARAAAKKLDWTAIYGTGTENMPRGVVRQKGVKFFSAETGSETVPADAQGGELDFNKIAEMYGAMEDQDVDVDASAAIISNPRFFRRLKKTPVTYFSGQTTGQGYLLGGGPMIPDARLAEYIGGFDRTTQIPSTNLPGQSAGWTTTSVEAKFGDVIVGNWSEMIFGRWGALEILNDQSLGFLRDQIYIKMRMYGDFGIRHSESFQFCPDARMRDAA